MPYIILISSPSSYCVCCVSCDILLLFLRLQVYPLHSSVTLEEQNNVFLSPVPGYRKVGGWKDEVWDIIVLGGELRCLGSFPVCPRLLLSHSGKSYWWEFVPFLVVRYFVKRFYEKLRFFCLSWDRILLCCRGWPWIWDHLVPSFEVLRL